MNERVSASIDWKWRAIATCLWIGYFPVAPATACALAVTVVVWISGGLDSPLYLLIAAGVTILGFPASSVAERQYGRDGSPIVIDEVAGQMIAFAAHPPSATTFIVGFLLFRFFDIAKPFPANRSQRLPSGVGVMMDDLIAGVYANLALRLLYALT